jgi:hypothetical protein
MRIIQDRFFNDVSYLKYCCPLDFIVRGFLRVGRRGRRRFRSLKLYTGSLAQYEFLMSLVTYAIVV